MGNLFSSSIGKKLVMSLSGLFLLTFLVVHLVVNLMLLAGQEAYNEAVHFMGTNPVIKIMEPILAVGFVVHIIYAFILTGKNMKARPVKYKVTDAGVSSPWNSRNMVFLGVFVLAFLVVHIANFYWKMKVTHDMPLTETGSHDAYTLVSTLFMTQIWYSIAYIISFVFLGLHLTHGFWSAFQTVGLNNKIWLPRLKAAGLVYTFVIVVGFSIIPIYFMLVK